MILNIRSLLRDKRLNVVIHVRSYSYYMPHYFPVSVENQKYQGYCTLHQFTPPHLDTQYTHSSLYVCLTTSANRHKLFVLSFSVDSPFVDMSRDGSGFSAVFDPQPVETSFIRQSFNKDYYLRYWTCKRPFFFSIITLYANIFESIIL